MAERSVKFRCITCNDPLAEGVYPKYNQCFYCWSEDVDKFF